MCLNACSSSVLFISNTKHICVVDFMHYHSQPERNQCLLSPSQPRRHKWAHKQAWMPHPSPLFHLLLFYLFAIAHFLFIAHFIHRVRIEWQLPLSGVHPIMMEKLAQPDQYAHPLPLYLPSRTKLWCTLQLREQINSLHFYSTPICTLCDAIRWLEGGGFQEVISNFFFLITLSPLVSVSMYCCRMWRFSRKWKKSPTFCPEVEQFNSKFLSSGTIFGRFQVRNKLVLLHFSNSH